MKMEFNLALKSKVLYEQDVSYHIHLVNKALGESVSVNSHGIMYYTDIADYNGKEEYLPSEELLNKNVAKLTEDGYTKVKEIVIGMDLNTTVCIRIWTRIKEDVEYINNGQRDIVDYIYEVIDLDALMYTEFNLDEIVSDIKDVFEVKQNTTIVDLSTLIDNAVKDMNDDSLYKIKKVTTSESPNNPNIVTHWLNFTHNSRVHTLGIQVLYRKIKDSIVIGVIYKLNDDDIVRAVNTDLNKIPVHEENREEVVAEIQKLIKLFVNVTSRYAFRRLLISLIYLNREYGHLDNNIESYIERLLTIPIDKEHRSHEEKVFEMNIVRNNIPILRVAMKTNLTSYSPTKIKYDFHVNYDGKEYVSNIERYMDKEIYQEVIHRVIDRSGLVY